MDDNELLRVLAKAMGWRVTIDHEAPLSYQVSKDGEPGRLDYSDEAAAWRFIFKNCGDWLHSVDAALSLPWPWTLDTGDIYYTLRIERAPDGEQTVTLFRHDPYETPEGFEREEVTDITFVHTALARALCEVFAAWAGAQEAKEGER